MSKYPLLVKWCGHASIFYVRVKCQPSHITGQAASLKRLLRFIHSIFDRLRSASGLKSASTPQICIHWRHYLKSLSDLRVFSNRHPSQILRSMANLLKFDTIVFCRIIPHVYWSTCTNPVEWAVTFMCILSLFLWFHNLLWNCSNYIVFFILHLF